MIEYKVLPSEKEGEVLLEVSGIKNEFTAQSVKDQRQRIEKFKKEIEGKLQVEEAKMVNVETHHPEVKSLEDKMLVAAAIYAQAKDVVIQCKDQLEKIAKAIEEQDNDVKEIEKQTGVKIEL